MDDKKRLFGVIALTVGLMGLYLWGQYILRQRHPEWFEPQKQPAAATTSQPETAPPSPATPGQPATGPVLTSAPTGGGMRVASAKAPQPVTLGNATFVGEKGKSPYTMGLAINPQGAGVDAVTLNRFRAEVGKDDPYVFQTPYPEGDPALGRAMATRSITVNGVTHDLASLAWNKTADSAESATYSLDILGGDGQPLFTINKTYQLTPAADPVTQGYEVRVIYSLVNHGKDPAKVQLVFNGTNVPKVENARDVPEIVAGYNDDRLVKLDYNGASSYAPDKPAVDLTAKQKLPLLWAGTTSTYWDAIVRPEINDKGQAPSVADVKAHAVAKRNDDSGQDFVNITFTTADLVVPAGGQLNTPFYVYLGPRQREILNSSYYANFPASYDKTLVMTSGACAYCTWEWLILVLVKMLGAFHLVLHDWGLAIIVLVLIVRLILHPITKRSQISMSKMGKMGPEIERLKKKYGDNKEELNRAMMEFYKEQGFGAVPLMGCLPMLLQMPIWIALWQALQGTFELRQASFLWGYTWIKDLAAPDHLIQFHPVTLLFLRVDGLNILPILMGVVMYLQQKYTPKPPSTSPEQEQQQKMMLWMSSLLFPLMLYTGPSGLNLYILTSTAIGIWESKRVRDHVKAQEEAEKEGKVIVDAKPTRAAKRRGRMEPAETPAPKGCLMGWIENIQKMAEDAKKK